ncbi:hypothetical protein [Halobaculum sp. D14]|uniref:hypothetical protein n=1 Tax=unclassified Halobaculum TaxID=2640896 RepID=UPI003EB8CE50
MSESAHTRRTVLRATGGLAAAAAGAPAVVGTARAVTDTGWYEATSPTSKTLYSTVMSNEGPMACGQDGNVLKWTDYGTWKVVVENGPATRANTLRAMATTDDGKRVWFVGGSGVIGAYDNVSGLKYNYSAPKGKTSTWEAVAVTGTRENETIYAANGSGEVLKGTTNDEGCVEWGSVAKPGSGSKLAAIDVHSSKPQTVRAVDTSSNAFETEDGGSTWTDVGIPNSQVPLYDVISYKTDSGQQRAYVSGGGGKIYRLDCNCNLWTPTDVGSATLNGVTRSANDDVATVGSSGVAYEKVYGEEWAQMETPIDSDLREMAYGENGTYPDVAVGASGKILERKQRA